MQEMTKDEQIAVMQAKIDEMTSAIEADVLIMRS